MKYSWDNELNLFRSADPVDFAYTDGTEVEDRLLRIVSSATDRGTFSPELVREITDWPSEYHLSRFRHCLIRPLGIRAGSKVLELGCGCGAITRYLGEIGAEVVAVEGSLRRAKLAAERCRGLGNVRVVVDDLLRFETDERFDFILLIGVLEYAAVFSDAPNAFVEYLRSVVRFLAPTGRVVVAIENKLGLKYFNGCQEDHVGIPYFGLQGLYGSKTARTFGRQELIAQLSAAGLPHTSFFYPFPDYKVPSVVLSEAGLKDPEFQAIDLLARSHARDYTGSSCRNFDDALVFSSIAGNGLLADLSNSFLVIASADAVPNHDVPALATAFSIHRAPEFCTQTEFARGGSEITVFKEPLTSQPAHSVRLPEGLTITHHIGESAYRPGRQLLWRLLEARARSGDLEATAQALRPWMEFLLAHARASTTQYETVSGKQQELACYKISGKFLDCIPSNLIDTGQELVPIDLEWQADRDIPLGWIVSRGVLWSINSGVLPSGRSHTMLEITQALCGAFGLAVRESEIQGWLDLEYAFQSLVLDRPCETLTTARSPTGIRLYSRAFAVLLQSVETAGHAVASDQVKQVEAGRRRIAQLEQELGQANHKLSSFSYKLTQPLRALSTKFPRAAYFLAGAAKGTYWVLTLQVRERWQRRKIIRTLLGSGLFDAEFYLSQYPDVADSRTNPVVHYLLNGTQEGRKPNAYFDTVFYLRNNPDVAASGINPLMHYLVDGFKEGREPSADFSGKLYLEQNSDVRASGMNPLSHYLKWGRAEGRQIRAQDIPIASSAPHPIPPEGDVVSPPDPYERAITMLQARDGVRRILVIDYAVPAPDIDSGSVRMFGLLKLIAGLGFEVTFASHDPKSEEAYIAALESLGVRLLLGEHQTRGHLRQRGSGYTAAIISRPEMAATYFSVVRAYAVQAELIYDCVDLHALRLRRAAEITGDSQVAGDAEQYARLEELSFTCADRILAITDIEKKAILEQYPEAKVDVVPNIHSVKVSRQPWSARKDLIFIGGFHHPPNVDAVVWFVQDVLPLIAKRIPSIHFTILGSKLTDQVRSLAGKSVDVIGWVSDPEPYFAASRIFVAPLRYGAGMKGKIGQAMSLGLPVVTTQVGAEGMQLTNGVHGLIADGPAAFAQAVFDLYTDEATWTRMRENAAAHIAANFSDTAVRGILQRIFSEDSDVRHSLPAKVMA
ncbi:MAG: glycosyltransferase [Candidatus Korobacteraceae bacterium]